MLERDEARNADWLKSIDDKDLDTTKKIFKKIRALRKSKHPNVKKFCEEHVEFFDYFKQPSNDARFAKAVSDIGEEGVAYYLTLLHTAGKAWVSDRSTLVSTSKSFSAVRRFLKVPRTSQLVVLYVSRIAADLVRQRRLLHALKSAGLPVLPVGSQIYPDQKEVSLRGGLLPHNIVGVRRNVPHGCGEFIVNPYLFTADNVETDMAVSRLNIDQSAFESLLHTATKYAGWFYTYDEERLFPGGES